MCKTLERLANNMYSYYLEKQCNECNDTINFVSQLFLAKHIFFFNLNIGIQILYIDININTYVHKDKIKFHTGLTERSSQRDPEGLLWQPLIRESFPALFV